MKMQWKGFACGVVAALLLVGMIGAAAATTGKKAVEISYNNISVTLDGETVNLVDVNGNPVEPFMLNNTNYLPVRAVSEALGLNVDWDGKTNTVILTTQQNGNSGSVVGVSGILHAPNFDFSIEYVKDCKSIKTDMGATLNAKDGKTFLLVMFKAKNTANSIKNLGMYSAYVDKQAVLPSTALGTIDGGMLFVGGLESGMEMKAYSIWEVPENWKEFQLYYSEANGDRNEQHFVIHPEDIK